MKPIFKLITAILIILPIIANASARVEECCARLVGDTLTVENSLIQYKWLWGKGELIPYSMRDKIKNEVLNFANRESDCRITPSQGDFVENLKFEVNNIESSYLSPEALEVEIVNQYTEFQLRRRIRIFPRTPAISFDYALKYRELGAHSEGESTQVDGIELKAIGNPLNESSYIIDYHFNQKHWRYLNVEFRDMTDKNDNLVFEQSSIPYNTATRYKGNLIWAENLLNDFKFFILKQAPNGTSQIAYPGYDFAISAKRFSMPLSGIECSSDGSDFISAYTITLGLVDHQTNGRANLRRYLKQSIPYQSLTHDMILMNTWGDRGQDGRIGEQFIINEINRASELGITHFQIDDGWQQGTSANSASKGNSKNWDSWSEDSWEPNKERFPNGLEPIVALAKQRNIRLGLWFNPSKEDNYKNWRTDADIIINLYKRYGIKYYKIDGVSIPTKQAAINFERFLKRIKEQSQGEVFFNLDLTAGTRGGYFSYRYAGNLFLENRYTDFQNYYPYKTLRNLWQLSQYFPPELLQIEFLNKWRNKYIYPHDDIFAPSHYDIDYLFAITMAAQPLAWCEATRLPAEANPVAQTIERYKAIQAQMHSGITLPIGDEPSGRSWTGFQTIIDNENGFLLIFREDNDSPHAKIKTYLKASSHIKLTPISTNAEAVVQQSDSDNRIKILLKDKNSFILYKYEIVK